MRSVLCSLFELLLRNHGWEKQVLSNSLQTRVVSLKVQHEPFTGAHLGAARLTRGASGPFLCRVSLLVYLVLVCG